MEKTASPGEEAGEEAGEESTSKGEGKLEEGDSTGLSEESQAGGKKLSVEADGEAPKEAKRPT